MRGSGVLLGPRPLAALAAMGRDTVALNDI